MRHMNVYRAGLTIEVEAPGFLQDLLARENKSTVPSEGEEQVKFLSPEVEVERAEADFPSGRINRDVTDMNRRCAIILREAIPASQNGFDACDQFTRIEWLGQIVVR